MEDREKLMEIEGMKDKAGLGNPEKGRTVYVVGHKNPDTDSICSAISYAYLKNQLDGNDHYVPARADQRRDTVRSGALPYGTAGASGEHRHEGKGYGYPQSAGCKEQYFFKKRVDADEDPKRFYAADHR